MSTKPLPDAIPHSFKENDQATHAAANGQCESVLERFRKTHAGWFVNSGDQEYIGPFADKADAQMALLYYSARLFWPSEKQLREFARCGNTGI